jgi:hypothetical protein
LRSHSQEVCGLQWNREGDTLASGGNDNKLCLWDVATSASTAPRFELMDHQAAVKSLVAWSPHERNLLATGGGTADRTIKFWNSRTGALLNSIDTESQVCALQWNPHEKEILSSHGFARNQLCLWKYPSMVKIKELEGHTARLLHMACRTSQRRNGSLGGCRRDSPLLGRVCSAKQNKRVKKALRRGGFHVHEVLSDHAASLVREKKTIWRRGEFILLPVCLYPVLYSPPPVLSFSKLLLSDPILKKSKINQNRYVVDHARPNTRWTQP